jgi:hypothetical protein
MHAKAVVCAVAGALSLLAVASVPTPAQAHWEQGAPYVWRPAPWRPHWRPMPWRPHVWQPQPRYYGPPARHYGPPPPPARYGYGYNGPRSYWR